jgi:hypothetical protein
MCGGASVSTRRGWQYTSVGFGEAEPVRIKLRARAGARVWTAGEFTGIGLTGADDLSISIERRFLTVRHVPGCGGHGG